MKRRKKLIIYIILRLLVILSLIRQIILHDYENAFVCIITLLLFTLPDIVKNKFKVKLPKLLESIIYIFIFGAEILGELNNFYGTIPHFDTLLHTISGFIWGGIGFSVVNLLNDKNKTVSLSPLYIALFGLCFSITSSTIWEFGEFAVDELFAKNAQRDTVINEIHSTDLTKDNNMLNINNINKTIIYYDNDKTYEIDSGYLDIGIKDTMKDMIVGSIGALLYSMFGYLYLTKNKYKFVKGFMLEKMGSD